MSKKSKATKIVDYIPEDIKLQILHKLPIKSLVRFTCVSKYWLLLIKNPSFISDHRDISISRSKKNPLLVFRCPPYKLENNHIERYSLYHDNRDFNHYTDLHLPLKNYTPYFQMVGTVNGLICAFDDVSFERCIIIIWNPSIKKYLAIFEPNDSCFTIFMGFGFDSRSNDYKILRVGRPIIDDDDYDYDYDDDDDDDDEDEDDDEDDDRFEFDLYSFNTNSWKSICPPWYKLTYIGNMVFVNGVIHFLVLIKVRDIKPRQLILGFDMGDEEFKEIMLPESLAKVWLLNLNVLVYKESIAVFERNSSGTAGSHLWVMKKYGVVESWTKIFTFNGQEGVLSAVLQFRKNEELFLQINDGGMVSYDLESREIKRLGVHESYSFIDYFLESMELLDNANAQSLPSVENDAIGDAAGDATGGNV